MLKMTDIKIKIQNLGSPHISYSICMNHFPHSHVASREAKPEDAESVPDRIGDCLVLQLLKGSFIVLRPLPKHILLEEVDHCVQKVSTSYPSSDLVSPYFYPRNL
jgi:hypothetical protein